MLHNRTVDDLLQIKEIYLEPEVRNYRRGQEILAKYQEATLIEVSSHWKIPELHGNHGSGGRNVRYKRGLKKDLVETLVDMVHEQMPYCPIRYAF